jgi:hypothetical protein
MIRQLIIFLDDNHWLVRRQYEFDWRYWVKMCPTPPFWETFQAVIEQPVLPTTASGPEVWAIVVITEGTLSFPSLSGTKCEYQGDGLVAAGPQRG